ncbi:MAG: YqbH/XkdH family protein [Muribaculaceae bacterium]|nr:YqbH/XkdH family protein [Muribaculaceae bacterium]
MYADFLNDRCDIYHLTEKASRRGYGIDDGTTYEYPDVPDIENVKCHFNRQRVVAPIYSQSPYRTYQGATKLQLPLGTDVRLNDRIVDRVTGAIYTASVPYIVGRNHHIAVEISRMPLEERI